MKWRGVVVLAVILLPACRKDIQNKEAVRQAVEDHLKQRTDLMAMDVSISAVKFEKDQADALVHLQAKGGPAGGGSMEMRYILTRDGNRWVVKGTGGSGASADPHRGATLPPTPAMPPGHPPIAPKSPGSAQ